MLADVCALWVSFFFGGGGGGGSRRVRMFCASGLENIARLVYNEI